jgi:DNA-directed RNA polymerase specialized sigma24 family protein
MGLSEDAARMRFQRALPKLAKKLEALRSGRGLGDG